MNNFVNASLICDKIRRFRLFNSSMISTISFVERYDFVNFVTIIVNRFSVSMSVFFRLFVKSKKRDLLSLSWDFRFQDHLMSFFFSTFFDVVFSSTFFDVVFFSTLLSALSAFFVRFFVSSSSDYRDSLFIRRFRFFSKIFQKKLHVLFHFSINLKKKNVKYFSNFWKIQIRQRKLLKFFQFWYDSEKNLMFIRFVVLHRDWKLLCVFCVKHDSICRKNYRKICERDKISHATCKSICARICKKFCLLIIHSCLDNLRSRKWFFFYFFNKCMQPNWLWHCF